MVRRNRTYQKTLEYTLTLVGGSLSELARRLRISPVRLKAYLEGRATVPTAVFLATVDLITAATREDIARSRSLADRARQSDEEPAED